VFFWFRFLGPVYSHVGCINKGVQELLFSIVFAVRLYMARYKTLEVAFKKTYQNQGILLSADLNDLVAADHPVRIVNDVLERIYISEVLKLYKPGGTSSYQPRMLLKVLVFGYMNNIYSSRRLEEAIGQNIHFMWLAGMNRPDHNTDQPLSRSPPSGHAAAHLQSGGIAAA
jgi:hypothetical protein